MRNKISISESNDIVKIQIPSYVNSRAKILFLFYGSIMLIPSFFIDKMLTTKIFTFGLFPPLFALGYIIILTMAGNNLLKRVFSKEVLEISRETLSITNGYFIFLSTKKYKLSLISKLHLPGHNYTPLSHDGDLGIPGYHAMGGLSKASNVDETIEFTYDNITTVTFGKNVPSWDAELVIDKMKPFISTNYG